MIVCSYVDLTGYSAMMGTLFRDPKEGEPDRQTIPLTKIVCGPSESHLVMLQLETYFIAHTSTAIYNMLWYTLKNKERGFQCHRRCHFWFHKEPFSQQILNELFFL